jgi:hypothetical protein
MASNSPSGNVPTTENGSAAAASTKRKPTRKTTGASSAASTPKTSARKTPASQAPTEILFKETPSPYSAPIPPFIWIDHPQENERLSATDYVIRLGVGGADAVELSIDKGPWEACRLTSGYWWFDWEDIARGEHTLVARMRTAGGQWYRTPVRNINY